MLENSNITNNYTKEIVVLNIRVSNIYAGIDCSKLLALCTYRHAVTPFLSA